MEKLEKVQGKGRLSPGPVKLGEQRLGFCWPLCLRPGNPVLGTARLTTYSGPVVTASSHSLKRHYSFFFSYLFQHPDPSNGEPTRKLPQGVVYGVVRRSDQNQQKEMVVYGWSTNQLKEEMNYIKDVSHLRIFFCFWFILSL